MADRHQNVDSRLMKFHILPRVRVFVGVTLCIAGAGAASAQGSSRSAGPATVTTTSTPQPGPAAEVRPRPPLRGRRALVAFQTAPFPYRGTVPPEGKPFLDVDAQGRLGRQSPRTGNVFWEDETYSDSRVLLYLPRHFSAAREARIVLYLHGNGSRLVRDVERRQAVLHQVQASGANVVLVAPQLAVDAADSSPGKFWQPGAFAAFLDEAAGHLARLAGRDRAPVDAFKRAPVVIVAYSGGYLPAAWALHHGGADDRIAGVVVLDGLYGEEAKFADWLARRPTAFFLSAYGPSSEAGNAALRVLLEGRTIQTLASLAGRVSAGSVTFLPVARPIPHHDFVTHAWAPDPVADVLARLPRDRQRRR
jgi:hypothetical protein